MRGTSKSNVVMVADDDPLVRKIIRGTLGDFASISEAEDGGEVLDTYRDRMPDLLFLDIHLPNVDGLELLKKIQHIDHQSYIVMISADSSPDNVKYAIKSGIKGFLTKPFERARIMEYFQKCPTIKFCDAG